MIFTDGERTRRGLTTPTKAVGITEMMPLLGPKAGGGGYVQASAKSRWPFFSTVVNSRPPEKGSLVVFHVINT